MKKWRFDWPEHLDCAKYPEPGDNVLCVGDNITTSSTTTMPPKLGGHSPSLYTPSRNTKHRDIGFVCPVQLKIPTGNGYGLWVGGKESPDCGAPCHALFFTEDQRIVLR